MLTISQINLAKCREFVFKRSNLKHEISPCTLPDVVRVNSVKLIIWCIILIVGYSALSWTYRTNCKKL